MCQIGIKECSCSVLTEKKPQHIYKVLFSIIEIFSYLNFTWYTNFYHHCSCKKEHFICINHIYVDYTMTNQRLVIIVIQTLSINLPWNSYFSNLTALSPCWNHATFSWMDQNKKILNIDKKSDVILMYYVMSKIATASQKNVHFNMDLSGKVKPLCDQKRFANFFCIIFIICFVIQ